MSKLIPYLPILLSAFFLQSIALFSLGLFKVDVDPAKLKSWTRAIGAIAIAFVFSMVTPPLNISLEIPNLWSAPNETDPAQTERELELRASDITIIQTALRQTGHNPGRMDGQLGPQTRGAVQRWQQANALPATGYLNSDQFLQLSRIVGDLKPVQSREKAPTKRLKPGSQLNAKDTVATPEDPKTQPNQGNLITGGFFTTDEHGCAWRGGQMISDDPKCQR